MQIFNRWDMLKQKIDSALEAGSHPVAAFDADGTLWSTDMGEEYFQYIIKNKLVPLPKDPMSHYLKLRNGNNPPEGYLWLAQILKGQSLAEIQQWGHDCLKQVSPPPFYPELKKLIQYLKLNGVNIFIVTASVKWAIESAATQFYEIQPENILGVKTQVINELITDTQDGPITWKQGKVDGLNLATENKKPFLAVGNSTGDSFLLKNSTDIQIAVRSANEGHMIYPSEQALYDEAIKSNWLTHDFR